MINKDKSKKLNTSKYCYESLTIQLNINHWFSLILWHIDCCWLFNGKSGIYNYIEYMIYEHIFRYTQLKDQTPLFLTIQYSISQQS